MVCFSRATARRAIADLNRVDATEHRSDTPLTLTSGAVPEGLRGTWIRNGPGLQGRGGVRYGHPFDGDGFVTRYAFTESGVSYRGRYVLTRELLAEQAAGRPLYRGFGTNLPGGMWTNALRMRFKNAANTSVLAHSGRLFALWEGGWPHELDPETLETVERSSLDGALTNPWGALDTLMNPELPFAAHAERCPHTGELWSFGTAFGVRNRLVVYRISPNGLDVTRRDLELPFLPFVHDFVLTHRYCVFLLPAVRFDIGRAVLGLLPPAQALRAASGDAQVLLVPRDGGPVRLLSAPPGFVFHWGRWTESDDQLTLEGVRYDSLPPLADYDAMLADGASTGGIATRYDIDLAAGRVTTERTGDRPVELPVSHEEDTWAIAANPGLGVPFMSSVVRWGADGRIQAVRDFFPRMPSEPQPVAPLGEDTPRWVLTTVHGARGTSLVVLDAQDLSVLAELELPAPLPLRLHGTWLSPTVGA